VSMTSCVPPASRQPPARSVAVVRRFPFSSALQRMSVVAVPPGGGPPLAFIKGSPEMVTSLCLGDTGGWGAHTEAHPQFTHTDTAQHPWSVNPH